MSYFYLTPVSFPLDLSLFHKIDLSLFISRSIISLLLFINLYLSPILHLFILFYLSFLSLTTALTASTGIRVHDRCISFTDFEGQFSSVHTISLHGFLTRKDFSTLETKKLFRRTTRKVDT
jgi:hypothetical protein